MFFKDFKATAFRFQSLNFSPTFQDDAGTLLMTLISLCRAAGDMSQNDGFFPETTWTTGKSSKLSFELFV